MYGFGELIFNYLKLIEVTYKLSLKDLKLFWSRLLRFSLLDFILSIAKVI